MVIFPKVAHWRPVRNPDADMYFRRREREEKRKSWDTFHQIKLIISKLDPYRDREIIQELYEQLSDYEKPEPPRVG